MAIVAAEEAANGISAISVDTIIEDVGVKSDTELYQIAMEHCATELERLDQDMGVEAHLESLEGLESLNVIEPDPLN